MGTLSSCKSQLSPCQSPYPSKCTAVPWNLLGVGAGIPSLDHIYALVPSVPAAPSVSQPGQVTGSYLGLHTKGEGKRKGGRRMVTKDGTRHFLCAGGSGSTDLLWGPSLPLLSPFSLNKREDLSHGIQTSSPCVLEDWGHFGDSAGLCTVPCVWPKGCHGSVSTGGGGQAGVQGWLCWFIPLPSVPGS